MNNVLALKDVSVSFRSGPPWKPSVVHALRNVSLDLPPGKIIGLVGESGSGKTTLGRVCLGLQSVNSGDVQFMRRLLMDTKRSELKGKLAAVFQNPRMSLNPTLKVASSVAEPLSIMGMAGKVELRKHVDRMLERVGLDSGMGDRFPNELSGGQRQRVSIARALITDPKFILFDEAVSALDVSVQAQILNLMKELQQSIGFAALFISHDLAATRYVADRVMVLYHGRVMEECDRSVLYGKAAHPYTRGLQVASGLIDDAGHALRQDANFDLGSGCPLFGRCPNRLAKCQTTVPDCHQYERSKTFCHLYSAENTAPL
mgnify:CR=1 FL=1